MCLGDIGVIAEVTEDGAARLETGALVTLAFVPEAQPGSYVLVHLGVPVEVLDAEAARTALALRTPDDGGHR